jgi:aldehyde dehydrogenase (NAD+)
VDHSLLHRDAFYVDGTWTSPASSDRLPVVSPSTEEPVGSVPVAVEADIDGAVGAAHRAFAEGDWPRRFPAERAEVLERAADLLAARTDDIAGLTVEEMGGAISQSSRAQTGLVAPVFRYYAGLLRTQPLERYVATPDGRAGLVTHEPVGVVGAIVPWNAPVTIASWKVSAALAAGCTVVLKPPPEAPLSGYVLAEALHEAGLPAGAFNLVPGGREVGEHLVSHRSVNKVAFTGSTDAGRRIMALCADRIARVSLELGGKSAALVLDDADLDEVVPRIIAGVMHLSGQVCGAHTRVFVPRSRYEEVVEAAAAAADAIAVGDPHDPKTIVGPLVAERQRSRVLGYVDIARQEGARVAAGGGRPPHLPKGWYVQPTVLADVHDGMRVAREEIFGPVVAVMPHDGDDDAVVRANDSDFGLAGGVWSADDERALSVAKRVRTGSVTVNGSPAPFPYVPFGGMKQSGLGRELGPEGLAEYLEPRSIGLPPSLHR